MVEDETSFRRGSSSHVDSSTLMQAAVSREKQCLLEGVNTTMNVLFACSAMKATALIVTPRFLFRLSSHSMQSNSMQPVICFPMEVFFPSILSALAISVCLPTSHANGDRDNSPSSSSLIFGLVIAIVGGVVVTVFMVVFACKMKQANRTRASVLPFTSRTTEVSGQFAPPPYDLPPPYSPASATEQSPPSYSSMGFRKETSTPAVSS